ncbi:unnamed protein product [Caenorhabditis nigoni]
MSEIEDFPEQSASDLILAPQADLFNDEFAESATDVVIEFKYSEQKIEVDDSKFSFTSSTLLLRISKETIIEKVEEESTVPATLSSSTPRTPLTPSERDQLRSMIVFLNESNRVLLKIRQRFPLSASTRCDVIQCRIQMQLQALFLEFRSNDEQKFKEMIPQNRETFLTIWDHLAQLIVESCYQSL